MSSSHKNLALAERQCIGVPIRNRDTTMKVVKLKKTLQTSRSPNLVNVKETGLGVKWKYSVGTKCGRVGLEGTPSYQFPSGTDSNANSYPALELGTTEGTSPSPKHQL